MASVSIDGGVPGLRSKSTTRNRNRDTEAGQRRALYCEALTRISGAIGHELAGSLNTMNLHLSLAQMSETAEGAPRDRNHHLVTIQQALQAHNATLRAFLEALAPIFEPEGTFDLREIVWKAEALTRPFSKEHRRPLAIEVPDHPVTLDGDRDACRQVLFAMLVAALEESEENAVVRFSLSPENQRVTVTLEYRSSVEPESPTTRSSNEPNSLIGRSFVESRGGRYAASEQDRNRRIQFDLPLTVSRN